MQSDLDKIIKDYNVDQVALIRDSYELMKAHRVGQPSQKFIIYAVKKNTVASDKAKQARLMGFVNTLKQNPVGITPPVTDVFQSESNYYVVFKECMFPHEACFSQRYKETANTLRPESRAPLVRSLVRIVNSCQIVLTIEDLLVYQNKVLILPSFTALASQNIQPLNSKLCGQILYLLLTGCWALPSSLKAKGAIFVKLFMKEVSNPQLNNLITDFIKNHCEEMPEEQELEEFVNQLGVNKKIKELGMNVSNSRRSYAPEPKSQHDYPQIDFLPKSSDIAKPAFTNSMHLSYDNSAASHHKQQLPPPGETFQKNLNLMTFYAYKDAVHKDEANNILVAANTSVLNLAHNQQNTASLYSGRSYFARDKSGFVSSSGVVFNKSGVISSKNGGNKSILDPQSCRELFQEELKSYVSQYLLFRKLAKSFLSYYGTVSNRGTIAAYLLTRSIAVNKLRLAHALQNGEDIFELGPEITSKIDYRPYIHQLRSTANNQIQEIRDLINFHTLAPETRKILKPYLGPVTQDENTANICFSYLLVLSQRDKQVKDLHTMMLYDALYLLRHDGFSSVYDFSMLPPQWDQQYVKLKKYFLTLLAPPLKENK